MKLNGVTTKQSSGKLQGSMMTSQKLLTNKVLTQLASRQDIKISNATSKQQSPAVQQVDINKRINQLTKNLVKYDLDKKGMVNFEGTKKSVSPNKELDQLMSQG